MEKLNLVLIHSDDSFLKNIQAEFEKRGYFLVVAPSVSYALRQAPASLDLLIAPLQEACLFAEDSQRDLPLQTILLGAGGGVPHLLSLFRLVVLSYLEEPVLFEELYSWVEYGLSQKVSNLHACKKQWAQFIEKGILIHSLQNSLGNVSHTAKKLHLDRSNLLRLLKKHALCGKNFRRFTKGP